MGSDEEDEPALRGAPTAPAARAVVAVVVQRGHEVALFRRSQAVGHDRGCWHCVTGYVECGATPDEQALRELSEETGLLESDLADFRRGEVLHLRDETGHLWTVHTFRAEALTRDLVVNWEHDAYQWTTVERIVGLENQVTWLRHVIAAAGN